MRISRLGRLLTVGVLVVAGVCGIGSREAYGRIKLITLPVRERVEVQLDHPNTTLVEEERVVPLVKGVNQVDFSWANTRIDPQTIVFRVLENHRGAGDVGGKVRVDGPGGKRRGAPAGAMDINVLSVSYPPNENALVWQVWSSGSGSARVRISYVLGGLSKNFHYRAVASNDEETLTLWQYMRLQNMANEAFDSTGLWVGYGKSFLKPVGINETKQLLVEKFKQVPIRKTYTCNPAEFDYLDRAQDKLRVPMHYELTNDREHGLGGAPLPYGKVRIFQDDGRGTTAFVGEDWGRYTPVDDQMRLYLGVAQDVVVKRTIERNHAERVSGNLHNYEVVIKYEIENFKDRPVTLDVAEDLVHVRGETRGHTGRDVQWRLGHQTTFKGGADPERTTQDRVVLHVDLPARDGAGKAKKIVHKLHLVIENEW